MTKSVATGTETDAGEVGPPVVGPGFEVCPSRGSPLLAAISYDNADRSKEHANIGHCVMLRETTC